MKTHLRSWGLQARVAAWRRHFAVGAVLGALLPFVAPAQALLYGVPTSIRPNRITISLAPAAHERLVRFIGLYTPADLLRSGVPVGAALTDLQFFQAFSGLGSGIAASGTLKVWLAQTTDTAMRQNRTSWSLLLSSPNTLVKVYDGPLQIPLDRQWFGVSFNTGPPVPHAAGTGYYLAWEWTTPVPGVMTAVEVTDGGARSYYGTGTWSSNPYMSNTWGSRPWIRLGAIRPMGISARGADAGAAWEVWPNPAADYLTVRLPPDWPPAAAARAELHDAWGRVWPLGALTAPRPGEPTATLDIRALPPGLYVARLRAAGRVWQGQRLLITR